MGRDWRYSYEGYASPTEVLVRKDRDISAACLRTNLTDGPRMGRRRGSLRSKCAGLHVALTFLRRCDVLLLNGDAAEKLRAFEAGNAYRVDPEVEQFLERLQRAA